MYRFAKVLVSAGVVVGALVSFAAPAQAAPVNPVVGLIAAGVPVEVVAQAAALARPAAAGQVVPITRSGNPGVGVDAVIDHRRKTITVIQRWLEYEQSRLSVGWVNLATGRSGVAGLPLKLPGYIPGSPRTPRNRTLDRAGVLPTGPGPVLIVVYGEVPGETALIGLSSEAYGYLTPAVRLLQV